jgi:hypothetical protein
LQEEINSKSKQIERYEKRIIAVEIENTVINLCYFEKKISKIFIKNILETNGTNSTNQVDII